MKSVNFVSLSAIFHAALLLALAAVPALKLLPERGGAEIEISTTEAGGRVSKPQPAEMPKPVEKPVRVEKPAPVVAEAEPLPAPMPVKSQDKQPAMLQNEQPAVIPAPVENDPKLEEAVVAADMAAKEFVDQQKLEVIDSAPAQPLIEDEIVDETVEAAATDAVNTKKFQEPSLPPPMAPTPKEELNTLAAQDLANGGSGPPGGRAGRSNLDLAQMAGNIPPRYPVSARRDGRQGKVILNYYVTESGLVKNIRLVQSSGHPDLDHEAIRAIGKYRYVPGQAGWTEHPVEFSLRGELAPAPSRLRTAGPGKSEG